MQTAEPLPRAQEYSEVLKQLLECFPEIDRELVEELLKTNKLNLEKTCDALLKISSTGPADEDLFDGVRKSVVGMPNAGGEIDYDLEKLKSLVQSEEDARYAQMLHDEELSRAFMANERARAQSQMRSGQYNPNMRSQRRPQDDSESDEDSEEAKENSGNKKPKKANDSKKEKKPKKAEKNESEEPKVKKGAMQKLKGFFGMGKKSSKKETKKVPESKTKEDPKPKEEPATAQPPSNQLDPAGIKYPSINPNRNDSEDGDDDDENINFDFSEAGNMQESELQPIKKKNEGNNEDFEFDDVGDDEENQRHQIPK